MVEIMKYGERIMSLGNVKSYKIIFKNNMAQSIEYEIEGKSVKQKLAEFVVQILNEYFDVRSGYYEELSHSEMIEDTCKIDVSDIDIGISSEEYNLEKGYILTNFDDSYIGISSYLQAVGLEKFSDMKYIIDEFINAFVEFNDCLKAGWLKSDEIKEFAGALKNDVFYDERFIKYLFEENCLVFIDKDNNNKCDIDESLIRSSYLYYSPIQYAIIKRFNNKLEELRLILMGMVDSKHFFKLVAFNIYLDSDEFVYNHLIRIMEEYMPEVIIYNNFSNSPYISIDYANSMDKNYRIKSYVSDNMGEFISYVSKKIADDYSLLINHRYYKKEIEDDGRKFFEQTPVFEDPSNAVCLSSFFVENFYSLSDRTCVTGYTYKEGLFEIEYMDYSTHKNMTKKISNEQVKKEIDNTLNLIGISKEVKDMIVPSFVHSIICRADSYTIFNPIAELNIDMFTYLNRLSRELNHDFYEDACDFYNETRCKSGNEYIKTSSFNALLYVLKNSIDNDNLKKVKCCERCGRFFIADESKQKYCKNTRTVKKGKHYTCAELAKIDKDKKRPWEIKKIDEAKGNIRYGRINDDYQYYISPNKKIDYHDKKEPITTLRYKIINNIKDVEEEYMDFLRFIRRLILLGIFDIEKKYINERIYGSKNQETRKLYLEYAMSILKPPKIDAESMPNNAMPTYRFFDKEELLDNYSQQIFDFSWENAIKDFAGDIRGIEDSIPYEEFEYYEKINDVYNAFSDWLYGNLTEELLDELPEEIEKSINYMFPNARRKEMRL